MSRFKSVLAASALLTASAGVSAHEFWLQPTAYRTSAGKPLGVYVCNGSGYEGWSLPRDTRRIEKFVRGTLGTALHA